MRREERIRKEEGWRECYKELKRWEVPLGLIPARFYPEKRRKDIYPAMCVSESYRYYKHCDFQTVLHFGLYGGYTLSHAHVWNEIPYLPVVFEATMQRFYFKPAYEKYRLARSIQSFYDQPVPFWDVFEKDDDPWYIAENRSLHLWMQPDKTHDWEELTVEDALALITQIA